MTRKLPKTITMLTAVTLLAAGTLAACGEPEPERWEAREVQGLSIPAIDWPLGEPDTSNEWVAALYESLAADAAATNNADYSSPYLQQLFGPDVLANAVEDAYDSTQRPWSRDDESPYNYYRGIRPFTVEKIAVDGEHATILVCRPSQTHWLTDNESPITPEDIATNHEGYYSRYLMVRENDTIRQTFDYRVTLDYGSGCDASSSKPGYFDPQPDYGNQVSSYDFIGTDGNPYYLTQLGYQWALEDGWTPESGWPQHNQ